MDLNHLHEKRFNDAQKLVLDRMIPRIYQLIFETPQFPFWFVSECYWAICVAYLTTKGTKYRRIFSFIITFCLTFVSTELSAFLVGRESPLSISQNSLYLCIVFWVLMELYPSNLLNNVKDYLSLFVAPLHTFNMMRILHFYNDETRRITWETSFAFGIIISIADILCARFIKFIIRGRVSPYIRASAFIRIILAYALFFLLTEETPAMIVFGILPYKPVGLAIAIIFAAMEFAVQADYLFAPKEKQD